MAEKDEIAWLRRHSDATMRLTSISYELEGLANAFYTTGNDVVAKELKAMASEISQAARDISGALGECIKEDADRSHQSTCNLVAAVLAGIIVSDSAGSELVEGK